MICDQNYEVSYKTPKLRMPPTEILVLRFIWTFQRRAMGLVSVSSYPAAEELATYMRAVAQSVKMLTEVQKK
jgi:hypothetical protein